MPPFVWLHFCAQSNASSFRVSGKRWQVSKRLNSCLPAISSSFEDGLVLLNLYVHLHLYAEILVCHFMISKCVSTLFGCICPLTSRLASSQANATVNLVSPRFAQVDRPHIVFLESMRAHHVILTRIYDQADLYPSTFKLSTSSACTVIRAIEFLRSSACSNMLKPECACLQIQISVKHITLGCCTLSWFLACIENNFIQTLSLSVALHSKIRIASTTISLI